MAQLQVAPYGSWRSPITSERVVAKTVRLSGIHVDGETVYWVEGRPEEGGRAVIVRRDPDGGTTDINPPPFNARTRVHEYGGGETLVDRGVVYFSNFADQRLYRVVPGAAPEPITPEAALRYADGIVDRARNRIICIREDHTGGREPVNTVTAIDLATGAQTVVVAGNDFYAAPRLSPDGTRLAWLTWNHPNMPWDGTELWVAGFDADGMPVDAQHVAGGERESVFGPTWSPSGVLTFASDRTSWWNLYRWEAGRARCLVEMAAEFGQPMWSFGMSTYAYLSGDTIVCIYAQDGTDHLATLSVATGTLTEISIPYTSMHHIVVAGGTAAGRGQPGRVYFLGGSPTRATALIEWDLATRTERVLRCSAELGADHGGLAGYLSAPEPIAYPTAGGEMAYGLFYPPANRDFIAPEDELPPLLVISHGGPTSATSSTLNLSIQYWTSRGFAVLDVNYGGSTGYGRAYRERLVGQWGVVDVDDCANGARYLVAQRRVDGNRLAIRGGSAGGYTTLSALAFRDVFQAGASHYGVSDLAALARDTHKFESRYLDRLVGPYPACEDIYEERSPLHNVGTLNCPVIFFQGLEDAVVPPSQAELMVRALRHKGVPVAYLAFEGEQHGFRRAENIKRALDAEFFFYGRIFGFAPADAIEPVPIENLE